MNKLNDYLPPHLQEIKEYKLINDTLEEKLRNIDTKLDEIIDKYQISNSDDETLERWNKSFDTNYTKEQFIMLLNNVPPFTIQWLDSYLKYILNGMQSVIEINGYNLKITLPYFDIAKFRLIEENIKYLIPANINLQITQNSMIESKVYYGVKEKQTIKFIFKGN